MRRSTLCSRDFRVKNRLACSRATSVPLAGLAPTSRATSIRVSLSTCHFALQGEIICSALLCQHIGVFFNLRIATNCLASSFLSTNSGEIAQRAPVLSRCRLFRKATRRVCTHAFGHSSISTLCGMLNTSGFSCATSPCTSISKATLFPSQPITSSHCFVSLPNWIF